MVPSSDNFLPIMTFIAHLASGTPKVLLTNGTVREARGLTSKMYTSTPYRELDVHEADHPERLRQGDRLPLDFRQRGGGQGVGRQRTGAVSRMDPRLLDVL